MRVPPIVVHHPNTETKSTQDGAIFNSSCSSSSKNESQKAQQNASNKKQTLSSKPMSVTNTSTNNNNEKPIVVNINTSSMNAKSSLEERATSSSFKHAEPKQLNTEKQCCFGQKTKDDFWVGHRRLNLPENFSSQNYSDSLPLRGKNRCYSVPPEPRDVNNNNNRSTIIKKQRRKTESDSTERLCKSINSSPCKRGRSTTVTTFDNSSYHNTRAMSLDRTLDRQQQQQKQEEEEQTATCEDNYRGSNETISSIATVENFERHLVSKIAERFAVEAEFSLDGKADQRNNNVGEDFYIDDEIDTIGAGLDPGNPIDRYTNDYYNENYLSLNNNNNDIVVPESRIDKVVVRDNEVINCNTCIGECMCYHNSSPFFNLQRRGCDSAEDTDERTDKDLR